MEKEILSVEETQVKIEDIMNEFDYDNTIKTSPSILVITESRSRPISGVRSCSDNARHQAEALNCLEDFLKDVIYANRNLKYIDSKIDRIIAKWTNRTSNTGKRSCTGVVTADCVARFQKD
jgi:hypothetical protein